MNSLQFSLEVLNGTLRLLLIQRYYFGDHLVLCHLQLINLTLIIVAKLSSDKTLHNQIDPATDKLGHQALGRGVQGLAVGEPVQFICDQLAFMLQYFQQPLRLFSLLFQTLILLCIYSRLACGTFHRMLVADTACRVKRGFQGCEI